METFWKRQQTRVKFAKERGLFQKSNQETAMWVLPGYIIIALFPKSTTWHFLIRSFFSYRLISFIHPIVSEVHYLRS